MLTGDEGSAYSYKELNTELDITYAHFPSINSVADPAPANAGTTGPQPTLNVDYTSPSGASVYVNYIVSTSSTPYTDPSPVWASGWVGMQQMQVPPGLLSGTSTSPIVYYWIAEIRNGYGEEELEAEGYGPTDLSYSGTDLPPVLRTLIIGLLPEEKESSCQGMDIRRSFVSVRSS
jgi:hypothetical protein